MSLLFEVVTLMGTAFGQFTSYIFHFLSTAGGCDFPLAIKTTIRESVNVSVLRHLLIPNHYGGGDNDTARYTYTRVGIP